MSQRILWGAVFSSVLVHWDRDSQFQTFPLPLHVRPTFLIGNWCANLGAMMCGKINTIVMKLVDSTLEHRKISTPKHLGFQSMHNTCTELLLTLNYSGATHFCVALPHKKGQVTIWPSLHSAKKRKKAARGVRFKSGLADTRSARGVVWPSYSPIWSTAASLA